MTDDLLPCASVLAQAWTFLDGECTDETVAALCRHLAVCDTCLAQYALEGRMKTVIATKCRGLVPPWPHG